MIQGRISTAEKAGRVSGTSKLGLELTQVSLVDGQQITLHSQMVTRDGGTSFGRDAFAIGATTAAGAAIGAGVNGGVGAGVGAAGGLVVSTLGVLLTRGKPAVIYPETVLTFKVVDPVTISTVNSAGAFRPVGQQDYDNNTRRLVSGPGARPGLRSRIWPRLCSWVRGRAVSLRSLPLLWGPLLRLRLWFWSEHLLWRPRLSPMVEEVNR